MDNMGHIGSRRRTTSKHYSAEEQALDNIAKEAEARLAARRQARAEAREIRMRELEKQQKEAEQNADRYYDMQSTDTVSTRVSVTRVGSSNRGPGLTASSGFQSSRRSSEDSSEDALSLRDMRHELKELEEKFRKAMIANAQLDNEKTALLYQVDLFRDRLEDIEESHSILEKKHKDVSRDLDQAKRLAHKLKEELEQYKSACTEKDRLIHEYGLVIMPVEKDGQLKHILVSQQVAETLDSAGEGSLDSRLRRLMEEKNDFEDQVRRLRLELAEEKARNHVRLTSQSSQSSLNGPVGEDYKEASKQSAEYKIRLQKAEQEIATLQATVSRLETQVIRYRTAAETSEKCEDELKTEKRKLQRELRDLQARLEEADTTNNHLQRRLDKLKSAKSAILKDI